MLHARLLRYLDEVARAGSIRKAGERLHIAAPAINRQILALEAELGTRIFERRPQGMVLTAAGEVLIGHVRQTLRGMERARGQIEALKGGQRGEVTAGVASGLAGTLMPTIIARLWRGYRHVKLNVAVRTGAEIGALLAEGEIDLGFGFDLPREGLHILAEIPAPLGAVVNPQHELAGRATLRLGDCAAYPLCVPRPPMLLRERLDRAFARLSIRLDPALETDSIEIMRRMALAEPCLTFLSGFDIYPERRAGTLLHLPLPGAFPTTETLILAARPRGFSPLAAQVAEIIRAVMQDAA
jgi:DNA-binding transcriptional LysR family regulator